MMKFKGADISVAENGFIYRPRFEEERKEKHGMTVSYNPPKEIVCESVEGLIEKIEADLRGAGEETDKEYNAKLAKAKR